MADGADDKDTKDLANDSAATAVDAAADEATAGTVDDELERAKVEAELAAAEAAAAAAAAKAAKAAAEAARARAKANQALKEADADADAVAIDTDGTDEAPAADDGEEAKADKAPAPKASKAKKAQKAKKDAQHESVIPGLHIEPNAEGLFGQDVVDEAAGVAFEPDPSFRIGGSIIARAILALALVVIGATVFIIMTDEQYREDMRCFVAGTIRECKQREVAALKEQWKDEDRKAQNQYGNITLVYYPDNAKVEVTQYAFEQVGFDGELTEVGTKPIDNPSLKLKEGQTIERLPLKNLPVLEVTKRGEEAGENAGSVEKVFRYEYKIDITLAGYRPRTIWLRHKNSGVPAKEGGTVVMWQKMGPSNLEIPWPGLDLEPEPETVKANFLKIRTQVHCYMLKNKIELLENVPETEMEILRLRNGFKTEEDFMKAQEILTAGQFTEWWTEEWKKILDDKCEGDQ